MIPSPQGSILDGIDECTWHISWRKGVGICEKWHLCPYKANQTLPNKDSQIHRVLVVWDVPLRFTQWQWTMFSRGWKQASRSFFQSLYSQSFSLMGFFPRPKPIPLCFYSKAILCFPERRYSSSCFPAITFLLTNLKPKFIISTPSSNQVCFPSACTMDSLSLCRLNSNWSLANLSAAAVSLSLNCTTCYFLSSIFSLHTALYLHLINAFC